MTQLRRLGRRQSDAAVDRLLGGLPALLGPDAAFPAELFHDYRTRVRAAFTVPDSSITPMMARLLFGLAMHGRPRTVWALGSYFGNALVWLTAPHLLLGVPGRATAVDVDPHATAHAAANFARLGAGSVRCLAADALTCPIDERGIDLLFIDVDEPVRRKARYTDCLQRFLPHLAPGALVAAHDVGEPVFEHDMDRYRRLVRDHPRIAATASLLVDPFGVEVSRVAS